MNNFIYSAIRYTRKNIETQERVEKRTMNMKEWKESG